MQHRVPEHYWNTILKLKLPPKVNNFLWHVCKNFLPTRMWLHGRGITCPTVCAVCAYDDEDTNHLFFELTKSIRCWQHVGLLHIIQQVWLSISSCSTNIFAIFQNLDAQQK